MFCLSTYLISSAPTWLTICCSDVLKVFLETESSILFSIVYKDMKEAMQKHSEVDVMVNFASLRSAYDATIETLNYEQV